MIYHRFMAKEILKTMGRRVRVLREEKGLNQIELAAAVSRRGVDCSNSLISSIETGRSNPSLEVFVAIADVLDVTLDYLATRSDAIESPTASPVATDTGAGVSEEAAGAANLIDQLPSVVWRMLIFDVVRVLFEYAKNEASEDAAPDQELAENAALFADLILRRGTRSADAPQVRKSGVGGQLPAPPRGGRAQ